jgi:UDP-glucose 4-epimerase
MRVLVTGGAGFIASHIVDALIEEGHEVAVVDNLSHGKAEHVNPRARFYNVDITDFAALDEVFSRERPETVNHHAAQTSVRRSMADPSFDAMVNIVGSINLLQHCVKHGASKFIFASTCAVYSEPQYIPMDEEHPARPQSGYGMSKLTVENYIRFYTEVYGLRHTIFRYGNVFGPRQDPKGEAGVVAIFTEQFMEGIQPTIFGDGTKTRDYVFVKDVARANLLAMGVAGTPSMSPPYQGGDTPSISPPWKGGDIEGVFNIARGVEVSDFEIFDAVRQATGARVEPIYSQKRPGEADRVCLNCERAKQVLGWGPTVHLREGVHQVVAHYRQRHRART